MGSHRSRKALPRLAAAVESAPGASTTERDHSRASASGPAGAEASSWAGFVGGRYRLRQWLAAGGMGEVWRAEDVVLGRPVAVKLLRAKYVHSPRLRDRFRDEARYAARLAHPNIIQVFDFGEGTEADPPYLVMEYLPGQPLSVVLARDAPLNDDQTWWILDQVASALTAAHGCRVVHGDIKPANVLLARDRRVKVADFGVARIIDPDSPPDPEPLGTIPYLAPERITGDAAGPASDLYALGILGYACLTGHPPFLGALKAVLTAHQRQSPGPLPAGTSRDLRELVLALLAKDPAARPDARATAAAAHRHLRPTNPVSPGGPHPPTVREAVGGNDPPGRSAGSTARATGAQIDTAWFVVQDGSTRQPGSRRTR